MRVLTDASLLIVCLTVMWRAAAGRHIEEADKGWIGLWEILPETLFLGHLSSAWAFDRCLLLSQYFLTPVSLFVSFSLVFLVFHSIFFFSFILSHNFQIIFLLHISPVTSPNSSLSFVSLPHFPLLSCRHHQIILLVCSPPLLLLVISNLMHHT